ncbi:hypothetical protein AVEN_227714-1, partial [Araneus ventricosus]
QAAVKSELDLFLTPPTQTAIEKGQWLEYHPIANIRDGNPIEFSISGSGEDYIDLSATQLKVKSARFDRELTLRYLLSRSLTPELGGFESETDKKQARILSNCTLTANFNVIIEHASLFVRKVKVSLGVLLGHAKVLQTTPAKYPIDRVLSKMYSISKGSFTFSQDNVFLGQMPKRLIITCVDNDAFNGTYSSNPFHFKHNLNFLGVYVDENPISSKPLEPDYSNGQSIRAFNSLLVGSGKLASNKGIYINRDEFIQGYTLYAFDLTPDLCDGSHLNLVNQGNLRIELKFASALEKTISVLVYAEFQNMIEMNSRNVLCDFSI